MKPHLLLLLCSSAFSNHLSETEAPLTGQVPECDLDQTTVGICKYKPPGEVLVNLVTSVSAAKALLSMEKLEENSIKSFHYPSPSDTVLLELYRNKFKRKIQRFAALFNQDL